MAKKKKETPIVEKGITKRPKEIKAKTEAQSFYLEDLLSNKIPIVFGIGPSGTGKTLLACYAACKLLYEGYINRIVLTRPVIEAGENLGFLPGSLEEKIDPYMRPLFDSLSKIYSPEIITSFLNKRKIELSPIAYLRGRTLDHCYIIFDEAQNATAHQIKMVLTRLGKGSKLAITGDETQIDLPKKYSGLTLWSDLLFDQKYVGFTEFSTADNQRRKEVSSILNLYDRFIQTGKK